MTSIQDSRRVVRKTVITYLDKDRKDLAQWVHYDENGSLLSFGLAAAATGSAGRDDAAYHL